MCGSPSLNKVNPWKSQWWKLSLGADCSIRLCHYNSIYHLGPISAWSNFRFPLQQLLIVAVEFRAAVQKTPKRSLEAKIKNKRKSRGDKTRVSTKNTWNYNWPEQLVRGRSPQTLWLPISGNAPEVDIEKCAIPSKHRQTLSIWTSKCCVSTRDTYNQSDKIKLFEPMTPQLNTWPKMGTSPL